MSEADKAAMEAINAVVSEAMKGAAAGAGSMALGRKSCITLAIAKSVPDFLLPDLY